MTKSNMDLSELLAKHDQGDFLRSIAEAVLQLIMEADVDGLIGAGRHERSSDRTTWRNGWEARSEMMTGGFVSSGWRHTQPPGACWNETCFRLRSTFRMKA